MSTYSEQVKINAAKAADEIRTGGWVQGKSRQGTAMCAKEAMDRSCVKLHPELGLMTHGLCDLVDAFRSNIHGLSVITYNDWPGRTKEEVLEVFDRIASS